MSSADSDVDAFGQKVVGSFQRLKHKSIWKRTMNAIVMSTMKLALIGSNQTLRTVFEASRQGQKVKFKPSCSNGWNVPSEPGWSEYDSVIFDMKRLAISG